MPQPGVRALIPADDVTLRLPSRFSEFTDFYAGRQHAYIIGTISGPEKDQFGSLLELTWGGKEPSSLETGETRTFIEDGGTMTLTGWARGDDHPIGFGACLGRILPAPKEKNW